MKLPCEKAIWYTLPKIRADIARTLVKEGLSQNETAEKLGVTPAAVSQYLHKKRAGKSKMTPEYKSMIEEISQEIVKGREEHEVSSLICKCCTAARAKN